MEGKKGSRERRDEDKGRRDEWYMTMVAVNGQQKVADKEMHGSCLVPPRKGLSEHCDI